MKEIIGKIRESLVSSADENTRTGSQHYFREKIKVHGVKTALVGKISRDLFEEVKGKQKTEVFEICEALWQSGYLEESFVACNWAYMFRKQFEPTDFEFFERWIRLYVNNWASCDTLCNHTIGDFVIKYPDFIEKLKEFGRTGNRWTRRAAAVSLILPARRGKFIDDLFEIADILLTDNDDMVQKGYGWMLKAASEAHQIEVFEYVMSKKDRMPRTALRYAIEKMPGELKGKAMQKERIADK